MTRLFPFAVLCAAVCAAVTLAQTTEDLSARARDADPKTRRLAVEAIGRTRAVSAVPAVVKALGDKDKSVASAAEFALWRLGEKAVPGLTDALKAKDREVRRKALEAFRRLGPAGSAAAPALALTLTDDDVSNRILAAEVLRKQGVAAKAALPALFAAAKDTSNLGPVYVMSMPSSVAVSAIGAALAIDPDCREALSRAAVPELITALKSPDQGVLQAAGSALAALGPSARDALPALEEAEKRAQGFAKDQILGARNRLRAESAEELLKRIEDEQSPTGERLAALNRLRYVPGTNEQKVKAYISALGSSDPRVRAVAADGLGWMSPPAKAAIPALLGHLDDLELEKADPDQSLKDYTLQFRVAETLSRLGPEAAPGLVAVARDERRKSVVRWQAARALNVLGPRSRAVLPDLERSLEEPLAAVAVELAGAYLQAGGEPARAVPVLQAGLKNDHPLILRISAESVKRAGRRARLCVPSLIPLLKHKDQEVRRVAAEALGRMGEAARPAIPDLVEALKQGDGERNGPILSAIKSLGPVAGEAAPVLVELLGKENRVFPNPVTGALVALGPVAVADELPRLRELLDRKEAKEFGVGSVPDETLTVLVVLGPAAGPAVPRLIAFLEDRSNPLRAGRAARVLAAIGPKAKEAVPALEMLRDVGPDEGRLEAAFALARITGTVPPELVADLTDLWDFAHQESRQGRYRFGQLDPARISEMLIHLGPEAQGFRQRMREALASEKTPAGARVEAARVLSAMGEGAEKIVPGLIAVLESAGTDYDAERGRADAATALGELGGKARSALPALRKAMLSDSSEEVEAAQRAVARIEER